MTIVEDIEQLEKDWSKNGEDRFLPEIQAWRKEVQTNVSKLDLKNNAGIRMLLDGLINMVKGINKQLTELETMTEQQRHDLFRDKRCFMWLINFFAVEESLKDVSKKINEYNQSLNE